ncbi:hypothetical protein OIU74_014457 [Salix koriyanagi]|uniref:Uncharacterized protein n=1 Tax=Salix koriyanagi TaxID=2511006 RepID=A0A9Q0PW18_9ROSI|nr:hypothetical protein OIU74_014457 [Salix koriyanagi]
MLSRTAGCREEQGKVYARNGSGKNLMKKRGRSGTPEQMKPWKHIRRNWGLVVELDYHFELSPSPGDVNYACPLPFSFVSSPPTLTSPPLAYLPSAS